jgi:glycosyltransferase EpsH
MGEGCRGGAVAVQWLGEKNNDFFFYAVGLHYLCKKIKKMKSSLVSILIPAYNAAPFLERSVASALGQSYADIEVVIVDDGSTDETPTIADGMAARDSRIKVVHQENRGPAEARRTALNSATGEYIAYLDADDELMPDAIGFLYGKCAEHGLDLAFGSMIKVTSDAEFEILHPMEGVLTGDEFLSFLFDRRCMCAQGEYLCRRELLREDFFPPHGELFPNEDVLMYICLSAHVHLVGFYRKPVTRYNYVPTSLSSTNRLSSLDNWERFFTLVEENLQGRGKLESLQKELLCMKLDRLAFYVYPLDKSKPWVSQAIHDHRFKLPRRYDILQRLLHYPKLCHWCVVNNRRIKQLFK